MDNADKLYADHLDGVCRDPDSDAPSRNYATPEELAEIAAAARDAEERRSWEPEIARVAAYLYRSEHHWDENYPWHTVDDATRAVFVARASGVASMYGFPHASILLGRLTRLCPCDPNPETTDGPQEDCLIHGDTDAVVTRFLEMEYRIRSLEK